MIFICKCLQHIAEKAAEKYETQCRDLGNKVDDLQKHVNDLAGQRQRLQVIKFCPAMFLYKHSCLQNENNELLKELHDNKVQIDNLQYVKHQLAQQLEEARRRLEDAERVSATMECLYHTVLSCRNARRCKRNCTRCSLSSMQCVVLSMRSRLRVRRLYIASVNAITSLCCTGGTQAVTGEH